MDESVSDDKMETKQDRTWTSCHGSTMMRPAKDNIHPGGYDRDSDSE